MDSKSDLIKDRALEVGEADLFDHNSISESIVELLRSISPPANIALYGPWGVGKSGLSNLIKARLAELDEGFKYVRFDAFKYAENPLRKHILSVMSDELLCRPNSEKFKKSLYQNESTDKIKIPAVTIFSMVMTMIIVMLAIALAFAFLASFFPLHENGVQLDYFEKVGKYIPDMILPSSILSAFVTLWGKTFTTQTTQSAPSQEEEFEDKFRTLVKAATPLPTHKIVIFVDELDRCAGGDVVSALDTIRTFMDSDKCMFIVAVDRHVLSASFKAKSSSASPLDTSNPQHGSVNEYLNKVFQYQIDMPPLKRQRLTAYANELVKDSEGVWSNRLFNSKEVVSILIPPSVNSPRRVKSLLNSFVIAFRIALDKSNKGKIRSFNEGMVHSLAKIVFLRNEYPRFFEHVCLEHRLPSILADAYKIEGYEIPFDIKENIAELVPKYIDYEIELYDYLSVDNYSNSSEVDQKELVRASGKQLLNYLSLTSHINIERELIFLEGVDHTSGLEPEFSSELETLAINNLTSEIIEKIELLKSSDKKKIISLLLNNTPLHDDEQTVQGQSVAITLLELVRADLSLADGNRNEIIDRTLPYLKKLGDAPFDALIGAVMLTESTDIARKERVFDAVLSTGAELVEGELASLMIKLASDTPKRFDQSYSKILSNHYIDVLWNEEIFGGLTELQESKSRRILSAALPVIRDTYLDAKDTEDDPELETIPPKAILDSLKIGVEIFRKKGRDDLVDRVVWFLDGKKDLEWYRFILSLMRGDWKPGSKKLALNLLANYGYFLPNQTNVRSDWLRAMNPELFDPETDTELFIELENQLLQDFITYKSEAKYFPNLFSASLNSLQDFEKSVGIEKPSEEFTQKIIEVFEENVESTIMNQAGLEAKKLWFSMVNVFSDFELLVDPTDISDSVLQKSTDLLIKRPNVPITHDLRKSISKYMLDNINTVLQKVSVDKLEEIISTIGDKQLILTEKEQAYLSIILEGQVKDQDSGKTSKPYDDEYIIGLLKQPDRELNQQIAGAWLRHFCTELESFISLLSHFESMNYFLRSFKDDVTLYISSLTREEHQKLLTKLLNDSNNKLTEGFINLLSFSQLDEQFVEKELIRASRKCQNINDRKLVLTIWKSSNITELSIKESLAMKVFMKIFKENKSSANLALSNYSLVSNLSKTAQDQLNKELLKVKDKDVNKRAAKLIDKNKG